MSLKKQKRDRPLSERISVVDQEGGAVLLITDTGQYLQVNEVGKNIVHGLIAGRSIQECVERISIDFDVDRQVVENDTAQFIDSLRKLGVLK